MFGIKRRSSIEEYLNPNHSILRFSPSEIVYCNHKEPIEEALRIMVRGIKRIPIVKDKEECIGILSGVDVLKYFVRKKHSKIGLKSSVKSIMTKNVKCINKKDNVGKALEYIITQGRDFYPVIEKNRLVGVVSIWDFIKYIRKPTGTRVEEIMSKKVISIKNYWPVKEVSEMMVKGAFRKLPVVSGNIFIGTVTPIDLIRYFYFKKHIWELKKGEIPVERVITNRLSIPPEADIYEAVKLMRGFGISGISVVQDESVEGIITKRDILEWMVGA